MSLNRESHSVSGEISDETRDAAMMQIGKERIGVDPEAEKRQAAAKAELNETEADLAKTDLEIRKLEAAAKAPLTEGERKDYEAKISEAAAYAEKHFAGDGEMATRYIDAVKKNFREEREGIKGRLERRRQEKEFLEARKAELEQKLRGEQPS